MAQKCHAQGTQTECQGEAGPVRKCWISPTSLTEQRGETYLGLGIFSAAFLQQTSQRVPSSMDSS
jgi:hypothetical protein